MPKRIYEGGKRRHHFTISDQAFAHLSAIAADGTLSRSEALERLIRSTPLFEGSATLADGAWPFVIDHSSPLPLSHEPSSINSSPRASRCVSAC